MVQASFRFYAGLNDFLPTQRKQETFIHTFDEGQTAKHLIEALGVPHPEVEIVLVNGAPVDFSYQVQEGDRVSIYPFFESIDTDSLLTVRPLPLKKPRFILDGHLGRLAAYLRMVGFDALYQNDYTDPTLACISSDEQRILLTRDRGLLKRSKVIYGYCLRETNPRVQLVEVLQRFGLFDRLSPFSRCLCCNGLLESIPKDAIAGDLPPQARKYHDEFKICRECGQVFWSGSHVERMKKLVVWALEQRHEP